MFRKNDLLQLNALTTEYTVRVANGHDIRIKSILTGHEWIIISPYENGHCEILHRHSDREPFHHQRGRHGFLASALEYIVGHDEWYWKEKQRNKKRVSTNK